MRKKQWTYAVLLMGITALFLLGGISPAQETAAEVMERALYYEDVQGDLNRAVELYEQILAKFSDVREIAAKAQLRIGVCYEKLGLTKAREAFQKVVEGYPEQTEVVDQARRRLSGLVKAETLVQGKEGGLNVRQLLSGPDFFFDGWLGDVSPDGRYVSIVDWETGDLAVRDLLTGKKQRLTDQQNRNGYPLFSVWSKDGTKIAYDWWAAGSFAGLRVIGIKEKTPRTVYEDDSIESALPMDWFPDGKRLLIGITPGGGRNAGRLAILHLEKKDVQLLPVNLSEKACVSPDGRYIAYNAPQGEGVTARNISLYDLEQKRELSLIQHPAHDEILGWSPDGRWILFQSSRLGSVDAWLVGVEDGKPQGVPLLIKRGIEGIYSLGFSRDGSFYYITSKEMWDLYRITLHPETGKVQGAPEKLGLPSEGRNDYPAYAPDGKSLAYIRSSAGSMSGPSDLHIRTLDTGRERVFPLNIKARFPCWSPDGKAILMTGNKDTRLGGIYRLDLGNGALNPVLIPEPSVNPVPDIRFDIGYRYNEVSPDGTTLYIVKGGAESVSRILKYHLDTKKAEEIYRTDSMITLSLSPDGKWLAFLGRDKERELTVIPTEGGEPRVLCSFIQPLSAPIHMAWAPDGRHIFFFHKKPDASKQGKEGHSLFRVRVNDGEMEELPVRMIESDYLSVHPSGRDIVVSSSGVTRSYPEYWVMENFLPRENKK